MRERPVVGPSASLSAIAAERGVPLNALAVEVDEGREGAEGLASAIRVFVLRHYQAKAR